MSNSLFLSPAWVDQATKAVQLARLTDDRFGNLVKGLTFDLAYVIGDIPPALEELYGSRRLTIYVELERGRVRTIKAGGAPPGGDPDFMVSSHYETFEQIYRGEINPATAFVNRKIRVEPMSRVYRDPAFSARSISTANYMLKILQNIPTALEPSVGPREKSA